MKKTATTLITVVAVFIYVKEMVNEGFTLLYFQSINHLLTKGKIV
ncbi:hypothetical protein [Lysinibacillus sp.]|nr:hypothetical protein [Lysinibacillus sp.]